MSLRVGKLLDFDVVLTSSILFFNLTLYSHGESGVDAMVLRPLHSTLLRYLVFLLDVNNTSM